MTDIDDLIAVLGSGVPVVIPTDTVYGVAVDLAAPGAMQKLFALKGRPADKPVPVLGPDIPALRKVVEFDRRAELLAERFWPGPLTLILPRARGFTADLGGDAASGVAVRIPAHDVALSVLRASGPLAVTSANRSGEPPATTIDEARAYLGTGVGAFLDSGVCNGTPSSLVSLLDGIEILREGPISLADIERF
ncbi:MAG: threonylcarbamoyl-AMP synthase [Actinobacteria bacterium]|nr:threonylcarbamoyl-AMP synthase [Actinomycetota bacterium]